MTVSDNNRDGRTIGHCPDCPSNTGIGWLTDGYCGEHHGYAAFQGGDQPDVPDYEDDYAFYERY